MKSDYILGGLVVILCAFLIAQSVRCKRLQENVSVLTSSLQVNRIDFDILGDHLVNDIIIASKRDSILSFVSNAGIEVKNLEPIILFPKEACGGCFLSLANMLLDYDGIESVSGILESKNEQIMSSLEKDYRVSVCVSSIFPIYLSEIVAIIPRDGDMFITTYSLAHSELVFKALEKSFI